MSRLEPLIATLRASPGGLTMAQWLARHPEIPRRTAQRWIQYLVEQGEASAIGKARARRYLANAAQMPKGPDPDFPVYIPLSVDSRDILTCIERPMNERTPVGYQYEFLEDYVPNQTFYLPAPLRRQLMRMGSTVEAPAAAGTYSRAILDRLLIDLSWASSHLEGNTYSRLDTLRLIEQGRIASGKDGTETQMILNHKNAIELLVENADAARFNRFTLQNLHAALAENLLPDARDEGRIRQHAVLIGQSVYRPLSAPQQIDSAFDSLLAKADAIEDPFEQSFFVMVHLPYLQPFADINKRTSRLAANLPLFRANLCPLTFIDVPEQAYSRAVIGLYETTRIELLRDLYVWAYERSTREYLAIRRELVAPDPFRQQWREVTRQVVYAVISTPAADPLQVITAQVNALVPPEEQANVQALIIEELRRLHEGVLARYGLRPAQLGAWQDAQGRSTLSF